jgi:hypothetical protein
MQMAQSMCIRVLADGGWAAARLSSAKHLESMAVLCAGSPTSRRRPNESTNRPRKQSLWSVSCCRAFVQAARRGALPQASREVCLQQGPSSGSVAVRKTRRFARGSARNRKIREVRPSWRRLQQVANLNQKPGKSLSCCRAGRRARRGKGPAAGPIRERHGQATH